MNCERIGMIFPAVVLLGFPFYRALSQPKHSFSEINEPEAVVIASEADDSFPLDSVRTDGGHELKNRIANGFVITGISLTGEGARLEISYPEGFTDRLNVYYASDLQRPDWRRIAGPLDTSGSSSIYWIHVPEKGGIPKTGFYRLGNYDLDSDGDGIPDWWEIKYFGGATKADADADEDGDGLTNYWEYRLGSNPHSAYSLDPYGMLNDGDYDSTGDGLSNLEEIQVWGTDPTKWDTTGNGFSDGSLVAQGHDPLDPAATPAYDWFTVTGDIHQDEFKTGTRTWTIPPGESRRFEIFLYSREFPKYTGTQSEFNDTLSWSLQSSLGEESGGTVNVNSRHEQWLRSRRQGMTMHGFTPVHLEDSTVITAPDDEPVTVELQLSAVNINDDYLPSTVLAHISTAPDTAEETEHPDPTYAETRDPINVISGNVTLTERDLFIPAPGLPLIFERHYHSRSSDADLSIGGGWRHTYDHRLESRPDETYKGVAGDWKVLSTPEGQRHWFQKENDGYRRSPEAGLRLIRAGDRFHVKSSGEVVHVFDAEGVLRSVADGFNNELTLTYEVEGTERRLRRVEHNNGQYLEFVHSSGRIAYITTPSSELAVQYAYLAPDRRMSGATRLVSGREEQTRYVYNPDYGVLILRINPVGHCFEYNYDFDAPTGPRGISMRLENRYFAHTVDYAVGGPNRNEVVYFRDGEEQRFIYEYDPLHKAVTAILGPGPETEDRGTLLLRDRAGNVLREETFDNDAGEFLIIERTFDERGNALTENTAYNTEPASDPWRFAWHETLDLPTAATDPDGFMLQREYSAGGHASVSRLVAEGEEDIVTTFSYFENGLLKTVIDPAGETTAFEYDGYGYPSRITPPAGPSVETEYTPLGHVRRVTMPGGETGRITTFETDAAGRMLSVTHPDGRGESYQYDLLGRLVEQIDTAGRISRFEYLPGGRMKKSTRYLETGEAVSVQTEFDSQFNLLRVIDPLGRNVESHTLDIQDRIVSTTNIAGQEMSIRYGAADMIRSITRFDGTKVEYTYDDRARPAVKTTDGEARTFTYTPGGRLLSVEDDEGAVFNEYDAFSRHSGQSTVDDGPLRNVARVWNPAGTVAAVTSPAGTSSLTYDPAGRMTGLSAANGNYFWRYNPDNGQTAAVEHYESGIAAACSYDITDRLIELAWTGTIQDAGFSMNYNEADMITEIRHASGETRFYTYDNLDRLTGERHYDESGSLIHSGDYEYDLAGNRTRTVINGVEHRYRLGDGDQLASWGIDRENTVAYDAAGNVVSIVYAGRPDLDLSWNAHYQLTEVSSGGKVLESYGYDPLGRRSRTVTGGSAVWHAYDGMHVVADLDDSGAVLRSYTWAPGIDNLLSITVHSGEAINTYQALTDHLGTVHALADETGAVVESYRYDAFGNLLGVYGGDGNLLSESVVGNRYLFQGREYSWATGLYYFRARWYKPVTGRWLSNDPIGIAGGLNQYTAFGNNPVMFIDPEGEIAITFSVATALAAAKWVGGAAIVCVSGYQLSSYLLRIEKSVDNTMKERKANKGWPEGTMGNPEWLKSARILLPQIKNLAENPPQGTIFTGKPMLWPENTADIIVWSINEIMRFFNKMNEPEPCD